MITSMPTKSDLRPRPGPFDRSFALRSKLSWIAVGFMEISQGSDVLHAIVDICSLFPVRLEISVRAAWPNAPSYSPRNSKRRSFNRHNVPHRHYTFSIPKVLRGLFERERSLLSLLSQSSYQSILKSFQKLFHRKDVRPGSVASIQTFGSYAANFNPHCHCLLTEGAFTPKRGFLPLPVPQLTSSATSKSDSGCYS